MKKISDKFYKIKRKHVALAIVKSAVCALSLGLFVVGVLLLALKLSAVSLAFYYYVLIGLGVALVSGAALFILLFNPSDKQVARRTDEEFALNERVQTALAYSGESGTLVELQRADAEEKINSLPKAKFSFAKIWKFLVIVLLAAAMAVTGLMVPAKVAKGDEIVGEKDVPRQVTELERAGVRELISNIEASSLTDELKTSVSDVLNNLLEELDEVSTEGGMQDAVFGAINKTADIITPTLTCIGLGAALADANQGYLGQAIEGGGNVYKYHMLTVYDEVRAFSAIKYDASNVKLRKGVNSFRNNLLVSSASELSEVLDETYTAITGALVVSNVSDTDGLYVLLRSFARELSDLKAHASNDSVQDEISETVSKLIVNLTYETSAQAYNAAIRVFVSNRLKTIFGYLGLELPVDDPDKDDEKNDDGGEDGPGTGNSPGDGNSGGSGGTGETEYGSDDMVWVPGRGYMKYGDVIDEYYSIINQYLHSDELTEEQKNMIRAYYDILFGSKKNSGN